MSILFSKYIENKQLVLDWDSAACFTHSPRFIYYKNNSYEGCTLPGIYPSNFDVR